MAKPDEETRTVPRAAPAEVGGGARDRACLIVIRGLNVGEMYKLSPKRELVIGRGQHADVEILDDGISRRHAAVRFEAERVTVADLGSRNGTFLNGQRLEAPCELHDGDKLQLSSSTILRFTYADRLDESFQRRMYESSLRDALTKAYNRKYFLDRLERELRFARRHTQPLALILLDIDEFKRVNDSRGHLAGDRVLAELAAEIHGAIRSEDVFARYGGEEFAVVCRGTDLAGALGLAERLRAAVEARAFVHEDQELRLTVSAGVALLAADHTDSTALLAAADDALYDAKRAGRNRVASRA
jgi:diguanylate cyclase (GGDEF)-like protein